MASRQFRIVVGELNEFAAKKVRDLALSVTANLVERTPIDTGWARANWVPRIAARFEGPAGSREAVSAAEQEAGKAGLLRYKLDDGPCFVSNGVTYITKLAFGGYPVPGAQRVTQTPFGEIAGTPAYRSPNREPKVTPQGFSKQAPNGFVEQAIEAALREVQ